MAYMRGDWYVYSDGVDFNIHGPEESMRIPVERMQELAAMVWLRLSDEEQKEVAERTSELHGGNFGAEGVQKYLGLPTGYDLLWKNVQDSMPDA